MYYKTETSMSVSEFFQICLQNLIKVKKKNHYSQRVNRNRGNRSRSKVRERHFHEMIEKGSS